MLVHDVCSEIKGEKVFLVRHDGLEHTIYEGENDEERPRKATPRVINEINEYLQAMPSEDEDLKSFTVEAIAEGVGISKNILYQWLKTNSEFSETLERLKNVQKSDPFKTGTFF